MFKTGFLAEVFVFALLRKFLLRAAPYHVPVPSGMFEALRSRWAIFGATAIGLYVGAEVSIGSIMINFLNQPGVLGLSLEDAGGYLANFYWGGALCGRIVGTLLLTRFRAARLLGGCAITAALLCLTVLISSGPVAGVAALAIGFFNSIMFPTVFTLVTFAATREESSITQSKEPPPPVADLLRMLTKNTPFLQIIAGIGFFSFANILVSSGLVYYVKYNLGANETIAGEAAGLMQITITAMILPWTFAARYIGKRRAWLAAAYHLRRIEPRA